MYEEFAFLQVVLFALIIWQGFRSARQKIHLNTLQDEVQQLRSAVKALQDSVNAQTSLPPDDVASQTFVIQADEEYQDIPTNTVEEAPQTAATPPKPPPPLENPTGPLHVIWQWLRANPLLYVGLIFFITGIAFAISYLMDHGFFSFSLEARLAGIALVGVATILAGYRLNLRKPVYGGGVMGGGAVILYLVLFAGAKWAVLSAGLALGIMVLLMASVLALALITNLEMLAALASLGGFMAPVLLSTGSGNYLGLFSFYALLCAGNVALLRYKAWDIPILIGYGMTVVVGTLWGSRSYDPSMQWGIHIFSIVFFILFNVAGLLLCAHADTKATGPQRGRNIVHASLLFGVPVVFFGTQYFLVRHTPYALALCALCMAAWYVGLARCVMQRKGAAISLARDAYLIIALGFSVLTVPLAVHATWTTAIWAIQGVGMLWLGIRREYPFARACGYILQVLAAAAFAYTANSSLMPFDMVFTYAPPATWGQRVMSSLLLAAAGAGVLALYVRHRLHREYTSHGDTEEPPLHADCTDYAGNAEHESPTKRTGLVATNEYLLFPLWQLWTVFWFFVAAADSLHHFWGATDLFQNIALVFFSLSALWWHWLGRRFAMPLWVLPSYGVFPLLLWCHADVFWYVIELLAGAHSRWLYGTNFADWPSAISLWTGALTMLLSFRNGAFNAGPLRTWALGLLAVFMLCALLLSPLYPFAIVKNTPLGSTLLFALLLVLSSLALARLARLTPMAYLTPVDVATTHYLHHLITTKDLYISTRAGGYLVAILAGGMFITLCRHAGVGPTPYLPLFSITDMTQMLTLGTVTLVLSSSMHISNARVRAYFQQGMLVAAFVLVTLSLARAFCWYTSVPFSPQPLMRSPLFLMALSLLWGSLALALIGMAARWLHSRKLWLAGAALLVLTVIKILIFDMADSDTWTRVISFVFIGVLMLLMGYFCPLPPHGGHTGTAQPKAQNSTPDKPTPPIPPIP